MTRRALTLALALLACVHAAHVEAASRGAGASPAKRDAAQGEGGEYEACKRDGGPACARLVNGLRDPSRRDDYDRRCTGGDAHACVLLASYFLNIGRDASKVALYHAIALNLLRRDERAEVRAAAQAIDRELAELADPRR